MACDPFHHQPAVIKQLLWKFFSTLHVPKKGALPTAPQSVLAVDHDALMEALLSRAARDLKRLLTVLVSRRSKRKCLQEVIHCSIPDVVRSLLKPGFFQQLYRLFVNRSGSQPLLRFRDPLIIRRISTCRQSISTESSSPPPWCTICTSWLSTRAPFPSLLSCPLLHLRTRRPPETIGPTVGNCLQSPFLGVAGERGQPQLLVDLRRNAVPEWLRTFLLQLLLCVCC
ncbi:hypothetical protein V1520DRAFT_65053 [Lipomyces starkeyi]|uniref:Uncharacterized protein n=1 Tax=Lipomyces starkeyi NRRL Y-11557 TaxID=675824 RepID=A0A1E3QI04_LIPST|nr:hypothetical protein LIPSTDRAFT_139319 [Lipomyces starkeyi NRRL Y-11557]